MYSTLPCRTMELATRDDSPVDSLSPEPISHLLGPIVVGVLINCFMYGIVVLHWIQYTVGRRRDSIYIRALVHWCFLMDTIHSAATLWMLWEFTIRNYSREDYLTRTLWPIPATPLFVALVSTPIQVLFAWRIKQFTHSPTLFAVLIALATASLALGFVSAIEGLVRARVTLGHVTVPYIDAWLGVVMLCDVILAVLLFTHLLRSRTGFKSTNTVIGRLMRSSVETTTSSTLFCICYLALYSALPETNFHILFSLPLGRIYTCALLSTLNSRSTLREELFGVSSARGSMADAFQISEQMRRMPTEVAINVEQEVQMEIMEEVDFKQLRKGRRKDMKMASKDVEFSPI